MQEGRYFAHILEHISRDVLYHLQDLPDEMLNRSLALPETNTLFALATHLVGAAEYWVLALIGERPLARDRAAEFHAQGHFSQLVERYERWLQDMHAVLDNLTGEQLDQSLKATTTYRYAPADRPLSARDALLHAVEHSALHLGHIQLTRQMLGLSAPSA